MHIDAACAPTFRCIYVHYCWCWWVWGGSGKTDNGEWGTSVWLFLQRCAYVRQICMSYDCSDSHMQIGIATSSWIQNTLFTVKCHRQWHMHSWMAIIDSHGEWPRSVIVQPQSTKLSDDSNMNLLCDWSSIVYLQQCFTPPHTSSPCPLEKWCNAEMVQCCIIFWPFVRGIHRSPVTRSVDVFFDVRLNKPLSKQSKRRCFETPWRSLWRHCNAILDSWIKLIRFDQRGARLLGLYSLSGRKSYRKIKSRSREIRL